ncbi:cobalt-precorrin-6A reductase [Chelativorans intermedius]|uniref:Cobalt-precorrin-6A reductase n=1 Tax=Chelativorans intermedius TaxID=515947 RepID=A0ABV6D5E4_9HYPH|nr:cobalt-precorrin-6A reductase [Chelativorans intermedius]MCT8997094.1 cobalt-precorrin-6A reductase [Chelativorans intermedius]
MDPRNVLILGGTGEARLLAEALAKEAALRVTLSLAGRTASPRPMAAHVRIGGFGGADGLARHLRQEGIGLLVDATHPFAARISENAERAAALAGVPLVVLERTPWQPVAGDRWREAASVAEAASLLGARPRRVFLAIGRQELAPFAACPQHFYLVRSVDPVAAEAAPANARFILERGPFDIAAERALLEEHRIDMVVAKNSGGEATYGKIAAARALRLPVIMVRRPRATPPGAAASVGQAAARIRHLAALPEERGV